MTTNVMDLDKYLDDLENDAKQAESSKWAKINAKKKKEKEEKIVEEGLENEPTSLTKEIAKGSKTRAKDRGIEDDKAEKLLPIHSALSKNARERLEIYLKKTPQYKVIEQQIKLLTEEYYNYKKLGLTDMMEKTKEMLNVLGENKKIYVKHYKNVSANTKGEGESEKIKASPELKVLKDNLKSLESEYRDYNPLSLMNRLNYLTNHIGIISDINDTEVIDFDEIDNIDEFIDAESNKKMPIATEYEALIAHIASIIDESVEVTKTLNKHQLLTKLKELAPDLEDLKAKIDENKMAIAIESSKVRGYEDITKIIFDTFDFEEVPEELPKDMLASANINYVKATAYNICMKLNMLQYYDDAISYGLVGLTLAINRWYNIQKIQNSVLSFTTFAGSYVANSIKKGLFDMTSGGRYSGSTKATLIHQRNKQLESIVKNNPELKDLPQDMLENILDGIIVDNEHNIVSESDYVASVGGDDSGSYGDIWDAAVSGRESGVENKNDLLNSLKSLFGLFQTESGKLTEIKKITKKKLFDRIDYKLFKLYFGFEYKKIIDDNNKAVLKSKYTQTEIAEILTNYAQSQGMHNKTFSQGAIPPKIKTMLEKLQWAANEYPHIKMGFEFLLANYMSDSIEEITSDFEKYNYKNVYEEMSQQFVEGLENRTIMLREVFDNSDNNPLDEEIANYFSNLEF